MPNIISSAEFRKTYPRLTDSTVVTANGHAIGTWIPAQEPDSDGRVTFNIVSVGQTMAITAKPTHPTAAPTFVNAIAEGSGPSKRGVSAQSQRDAILRKINKG